MKSMKRAVCAVVAALLSVCAVQGGEPASIEGQVLLQETGEPVAGVTVIIRESGALTITDRQGEFKFEGVQPGRYHLSAHLDSALRNVSKVVLAAPGETARPQLLLSFSTQRTEITVSATGRPESAFETFQSTHSLTLLDLARAESIAAGLGEAIGNQPGTGIAWRGFGPGSSRPLIRGFDGDRVLIMTDDLPTGSISSNSGDHAETFNPLAFERVEVVKGPATLLYGSNAMGGVVNAINEMTDRERCLRNTLPPPTQRSVPFIDSDGPVARETLGIAPSAGIVKNLGLAITGQAFHRSCHPPNPNIGKPPSTGSAAWIALKRSAPSADGSTESRASRNSASMS